MMKKFLVILLLFVAHNSYAQLAGGAGTCHVNGNPNSIAALEVQDLVSGCMTAIDTTNGTLYRYNRTLSQGARWVEIVSGSSGGVSITSTTLETSSITAVKGKITLVDCSAAVRTVAPPSSPATNDRFAVSDAKAASATYNITVDFTTATQKLYGVTQNYIINANGGYVEFIYVDATTGWIATKG